MLDITRRHTTTNKKVAIQTLGCRLNFAESGTIAQGFARRGYQAVNFGEPADVTVINTCTVTDGADSTCRRLIRKAHRTSPEGKIVVVGCYAQMEADKIAKMQGIDLILGTGEKHRLFDYLDEEERNLINIKKSKSFFPATTSIADQNHTRAFLKIQDGCNYVCSFCIIPQARGRSRTISIANALAQLEGAVAQGFKEVVLTGVNIGEYEQSSKEKLTDLISTLLQVKGLERLRLSSIEVNTINDELLEVLSASPKFMPHFHIPMQSGDDNILHLMKRKYTPLQYAKVIEKIKKIFPSCAIGADVICGFPSETKEQFNATFNMLKELPITHFHIFPYSQRKNTIAAKMTNHIQTEIKKDRVAILNDLGKKKITKFASTQVGTTRQVLFENKNKFGKWEGYSDNFLRTEINSNTDLKNKVCKIFITDSREDHLLGTISSERL